MKEGTQRRASICFTRTAVSVCDLIPEFMSFVSLDCTYAGSKINHSDTQTLFIFIFSARLYLYLYIQYILTNLMLMRFFASSPFTCRNVIFKSCVVRHFVCSLLPPVTAVLLLYFYFFSYIDSFIHVERVSFGSLQPVKTKVVIQKEKTWM